MVLVRILIINMWYAMDKGPIFFLSSKHNSFHVSNENENENEMCLVSFSHTLFFVTHIWSHRFNGEFTHLLY
jgi:hypothetical protein